MTYDRRDKAAATRTMRELAELFLKLEGYPPATVRKWTDDMAKAFTMAISGNRAVTEVLHNMALADMEYERHHGDRPRR